jgi:uncharacterized membrane protein
MATLVKDQTVVDAGPEVAARRASDRLDSIDLVRGLVIVIMALDHSRGNFTNPDFDITNIHQTTPIWFLTRWITHYCAPTFVFLAGTGAFLFSCRGKTKRDLAWFLVSRGLWLIFLELTVIRLSWFYSFQYHFAFGQVIWAIGWSMIVLAPMVYLPVSAIAVFGVSMIAFHNLFDGVKPDDWGNFRWLWIILHTGERIQLTQGGTLNLFGLPPIHFSRELVFNPFYPLIPWIGVLAAGYALGAMFLLNRPERRRNLLGLGLTLILAFLVLRYLNWYGDRPANKPGEPGPWAVFEAHWWQTPLAFINCQKYPPSLMYLLMTLGPAITALALFDRQPGPLGRFFITYGRVPLFFYLPHFFILHGLAIVFAYLRYGRADWLFQEPPGIRPGDIPKDNGYDLWVAYLVWLGVVLALYFPCRWFAGVKRRYRNVWWLSYL